MRRLGWPGGAGGAGAQRSARSVRRVFLGTGLARGALVPFAAIVLSESGLGPGAVGLVLGAAAAALVLALPVWGLLTDRVLGPGRTLAMGAGLATVGAVAGSLGGDTRTLAVAIPIATAGISAAWPVGDALALRVLGDAREEYGSFRRWTSAGWATSALVVGALYGVLGAPIALGAFAVASLFVATTAAGLSSAHGRPTPGSTAPAPREAPRSATGRASIRAVARDRALVGFLVAVFLVGIGTAAATAFVPLRVVDAGGGAFVIGLAAAIPALVEVPLFTSMGSLLRRSGPERLYVGGAVLAAAWIATLAMVPLPAVVALVSVADGASFACRQASTVLVVDRRVPVSLRAFGQSLGWFASAGCAPIVAATAGGVIYASAGGTALFWCAAVTVVAGASLAALVLRAPSSGTGEPRSRRR